ncbi:LAMI_0H17172g1_1 [Lachancea mirantina]|uniref:LAMI_0H17172g1_1 n=1 Tax=Lachancea mirantina TaxID=1230905 RepID=A0A1G4KJA7_9SACH|nr:LAMI_0H17172g1_1 [Lachancea mirantina]
MPGITTDFYSCPLLAGFLRVAHVLLLPGLNFSAGKLLSSICKTDEQGIAGMMKNRRAANNTLNSPVVVHAGASEHVSDEKILQFLSAFIKEREDEADADTSGALAQLRRIERDFKGLPPTVLES